MLHSSYFHFKVKVLCLLSFILLYFPQSTNIELPVCVAFSTISVCSFLLSLKLSFLQISFQRQLLYITVTLCISLCFCLLSETTFISFYHYQPVFYSVQTLSLFYYIIITIMYSVVANVGLFIRSRRDFCYFSFLFPFVSCETILLVQSLHSTVLTCFFVCPTLFSEKYSCKFKCLLVI